MSGKFNCVTVNFDRTQHGIFPGQVTRRPPILYILVQSFRVNWFFTDQYNTEDYGKFRGVKYSFGESMFFLIRAQ